MKWLPDGLVQSSRSFGTHSTTAQVHPRLFTTFLGDQYISQRNTSIILGQATSLQLTQDSVSSITVGSTEHGDQTLPADAVVIAAGPWTGDLAVRLLGEKVGARLGVTGHRAHSIVLKTKEELSAHCLFTSMVLKDGSRPEQGEPEVYTRPDGTTYVWVSSLF